MSTQGKYGAEKTRTPRKLSRVSGFRRDHMYTNVLLSAEPRKGRDSNGDATSKILVAYISSHEKCAGERPADSSSRREYL